MEKDDEAQTAGKAREAAGVKGRRREEREDRAYQDFLAGGWGLAGTVGRYLGHTARWVREQVRRGYLPALRTCSGWLLFRRGDIDAAILRNGSLLGAKAMCDIVLEPSVAETASARTLPMPPVSDFPLPPPGQMRTPEEAKAIREAREKASKPRVDVEVAERIGQV